MSTNEHSTWTLANLSSASHESLYISSSQLIFEASPSLKSRLHWVVCYLLEFDFFWINKWSTLYPTHPVSRSPFAAPRSHPLRSLIPHSSFWFIRESAFLSMWAKPACRSATRAGSCTAWSTGLARMASSSIILRLPMPRADASSTIPFRLSFKNAAAENTSRGPFVSI